MQYGSFVKISTETDYNKATQQERECRACLHDLVSALVNQYFEQFAAKTKKAEHAEMVRLGITSAGYRDFLKRKNEGNSPAQMCSGLNNRDWLTDLARASSVEAELNRLRLAYENAEAATRAACKKIVRRRIPEHRPPMIGDRSS
jgi:hypothetical protein